LSSRELYVQVADVEQAWHAVMLAPAAGRRILALATANSRVSRAAPAAKRFSG
jgi:hypothetical protein